MTNDQFSSDRQQTHRLHKPTSTNSQIDQMSQCIIESENLTERTDHWHEYQKDQLNSICDISYANTTDELDTMKGDNCWSDIDSIVMLMMVMGLNGRDCGLLRHYQYRQLNQTSKSWGNNHWLSTLMKKTKTMTVIVSPIVSSGSTE